uniref:Methyltransferase type 11 domain-containing protein n=1 Tax=Panagrolaimus davidi TaxID=227884 RepID=A0A914QRQ0_9BILA
MFHTLVFKAQTLLNKRTLLHFTAITIVITLISFFIFKHWSFNDKKINRKKNCKISDKQYQESEYAHKLLDGLKGIEIGASSYSPFCLDTINVNYSNNTKIFRETELKVTGTYVEVDVVASGDNLPFANDSYDFVINGHVIEHFYDPIKAIEEWLRVIKKGGYVFMIIPHKERTFDKTFNRTTLNEIIERHENKPDPGFVDDHGHHSIWITEDFIKICQHFNWKIHSLFDTDDKGGISFTVVLQKQ